MRRVLLIALAAAALASCGRPGKHEAAAPPAPQATPAAAPDTAGPPPALPAWASGYLGKILPEAFPQTGECAGNTDGIKHRYAGPPRATQVVGWGWETAAK